MPLISTLKTLVTTHPQYTATPHGQEFGQVLFLLFTTLVFNDQTKFEIQMQIQFAILC